MTLPMNATQFEGSSRDSPMDIVIGFDFGTSCTKVVLQDPPSRTAYAVPFGELGIPDNPFLLSSKLGLSSEGNCCLVRFDQPGVRGIKRRLMISPFKTFTFGSSHEMRTNALGLASIYIALVLQHARLWFLSKFQDEYGRKKIRWHLNLGIPAKNYDDRRLKLAFLTAARIGWWLSVNKETLTIESALETMVGPSKGAFLSDPNSELIQVVPEVAAEVAAYARSSLRQLGLHMIVDVGASTTDVAAFRLQAPEGEFEYWFLWAEVCDDACFSLHKCRVNAIEGALTGWLEKLKEMGDSMAWIPNNHEGYAPPRIPLIDVDKGFIARAVVPITRVFAISRKRRDPNAREWQRGVPLFLCGGGSELSIFNEDLLQKSEERLRNFNWGGFRFQSLPKPDELKADGLTHRSYHRLAVAYGLSFFFEDIGKIVPPSEIEDVGPNERIKVVNYVSKDMV